MSQLQAATLLAMLTVGGLAIAGRRPSIVEFRGALRQALATGLLVAILTVAVFSPLTAFGEAHDIDTSQIWLPIVFVGHVLLTMFLVLWWTLRRNGGFFAFLHVSATNFGHNVRLGLAVGAGGWLLTIAVTGLVTGAAALVTGGFAEPLEVPPIVHWLATLPVADKLLVIAAAMTVEEAFFRGFLQPRFGLVVSSVLFAFAHFSYGLPSLAVGVFTLSLIIGYTFDRTRSLVPCIVVHGMFDAIQLLVVLPWAVRLLESAA